MTGAPTSSDGGKGVLRATTVLPARRSAVRLRTADGLALVGELALPVDRDPVATLITLHPLPTAGGSMDSHLLRKMSFRLPALAGIAVLRFNTRGTSSEYGTSEGVFDHGDSERFDVAAAIGLARLSGLPRRWLVGWSFGADLAIRHGCGPTVEGAILLSPALRWAGQEHLAQWAGSGKLVLALVPELDHLLRPDEARRRFAVLPEARVVGVRNARHLWGGEPWVRRALDEIVAVVHPDGAAAAPLPATGASTPAPGAG